MSNKKADIWIVVNWGGSKSCRKLLVENAKKSKLSYRLVDVQFLFWVGNKLFYKFRPVKHFPKLILSRTSSPSLRKLVDKRPDIITLNSNHCYQLVHSKLASHIELEKHKIRQPRFSAWSIGDTYEKISEQLGNKFVIKNVYGFKGNQVFLVSNQQEFRKALCKCNKKNVIYQEFIEISAGRDIRVIVLDGKVLVAFQRLSQNGDFRANLSQGGKAAFITLTPEQENLAIRIYEILHGEHLSIDFLVGNDGEFIFCEANLHTALRMLFDYKTHNINHGATLMEHIKQRIKQMEAI
ncbi:MAG: RimK family alpha-L-glutamate ligase [Firmicutes bacterium]|nr:RimK family alpha-L-glutamate ligase [Bacillota bacterium]